MNKQEYGPKNEKKKKKKILISIRSKNIMIAFLSWAHGIIFWEELLWREKMNDISDLHPNSLTL